MSFFTRAVALFVGLGLGIAAPAVSAAPAKVKFDLYIMSKCPYAKPVVNSLNAVLAKVGDHVEFTLDYIGTEKDGVLGSLHGQPEVDGDLVGVCLRKYLPEDYAWLSVFSCMMSDMPNIPANWTACCQKNGDCPGVIELVTACSAGAEGLGLLQASFGRSAATGARGSPTIRVANQDYKGGRSDTGFLRAICKAFGNQKAPPACADLPALQAVNVIVIGDERCTEPSCNIPKTEGMLANMLPGFTVVKRLDWSSPEARQMCEQEGIKLLPAFLLSPNVEKAEGSESVQRYLKPTATGNYRWINVGANFDPTAEICNNGLDDTQDGLADCDDPTCKESFVCRPITPGQLELFLMSQCPFAAKALVALNQLMPAFGRDVKVVLHFIGSEVGGAPTSMHGDSEVEGDLLFMCAQKVIVTQPMLMAFLGCLATDLRNLEGAWQGCAKQALLGDDSVDSIERCRRAPDARQKLLANFKIAESLKITGSPTWVVNGRHKFNGVTAEVVKKNLCDNNPGLAGCVQAPQN